MLDLRVKTRNGSVSRFKMDTPCELNDRKIMYKAFSRKTTIDVLDIEEVHVLECEGGVGVVNVGEFENVKVLTLPKDIHISHIWCEDTKIRELEVPLSVSQIKCNPNTEITNFDELGDDVELLMVPVHKTLEQVMRE